MSGIPGAMRKLALGSDTGQGADPYEREDGVLENPMGG